mmetsp:Transcript_37616/g.70113  ORF Transcript_37616/g.70113 Transcript_37616/m.70113 type:complete len:108 (+) Transcript_37616:1364-1687(+)
MQQKDVPARALVCGAVLAMLTALRGGALRSPRRSPGKCATAMNRAGRPQPLLAGMKLPTGQVLPCQKAREDATGCRQHLSKLREPSRMKPCCHSQTVDTLSTGSCTI